MVGKPFSIAIIGVHASGKTTTATLLADRLGYRYVEVEEIYDTEELGIRNHVHRQLVFVSGYTRTFTVEYYRTRRLGFPGIVFDSHPILNVPYIEYWVGGRKGQKLARAQLVLARLVPRVDLGVLLDMDDINVIVERIWRRKRSVARMEAQPDYIQYIAEGLRRVFQYMPARHQIVVPASLEVEERVEIIIREFEKLLGVRRHDQ